MFLKYVLHFSRNVCLWGVVFLLVTNGKSRWHSGAPLLFFAGGKPHSNIKNIKIWTREIEKVLKNEK